MHLDDALADCDPAPAGDASDRVTTWGTPRDLSTWSGPQVADLAWAARAAELDVLAAGPASATARCASCWRCRAATGPSWPRRGTAGDYPRERFAGTRASSAPRSPTPRAEPALRNLAPRLARAALLEP